MNSFRLPTEFEAYDDDIEIRQTTNEISFSMDFSFCYCIMTDKADGRFLYQFYRIHLFIFPQPSTDEEENEIEETNGRKKISKLIHSFPVQYTWHVSFKMESQLQLNLALIPWNFILMTDHLQFTRRPFLT